jgi:hypothetical protein
LSSIITRDGSDVNCSFAAVPNIGELKALTHLYLNSTGITGTVDFDHHPAMITDFVVHSFRIDP